MISCIIIESLNIVKENYKDKLKEIFRGYYLEINEYEKERTFIFIYEVDKIQVWQAVLNLEVDQIPVGFGFGVRKEMARQEALERLKIVSEMSIY